MQPTNLQPLRTLQRNPIVVAIVSFVLMHVILSTKSEAHEFEDGFVERSMAVVIRDDIARVEYSIGLNPKTKDQLIKFWTSHARRPSTTPNEATLGETSPVASSESVDFLKLAGDQVSRRLRVAINDDLVTPRLISSLASSRHHVDVTVTMEFAISLDRVTVPTVIEIADRNFFPSNFLNLSVTEKPHGVMEQDSGGQFREELRADNSAPNETQLRPAPFGGAFRYAIKAKGGAVLNRSNVASILIRAKRQLDANFSEAELDDAYKIKAEVVIVE